MAGLNRSLLTHLYQEEVYHFTHLVTVVLARPWASYSAEEHAMLYRMLGAVHVSPGRVRTLVRPSLNLKSLIPFSPERVLVFGSTIQDSEVPLYQDTSVMDFRVIRAEDLDALDDQKKKILWAALRQMFGL